MFKGSLGSPPLIRIAKLVLSLMGTPPNVSVLRSIGVLLLRASVVLNICKSCVGRFPLLYEKLLSHVFRIRPECAEDPGANLQAPGGAPQTTNHVGSILKV